jgi:hypothetical protein
MEHLSIIYTFDATAVDVVQKIDRIPGHIPARPAL